MDKPLDNPLNWSFRIGRLFDITIRLHVLFILGALFILFQTLSSDSVGGSVLGMVGYVLGTYAILFGIVLLHEFGHCWGARHMGGEADEILLWPLGGLAYTNPPHTPRGHLVTTVAGPAVNVIICLAASIVLVICTQSLGAVPWNPFYPFSPTDAALTPAFLSARFWVVQAFGLSYFLFVVNLFPIFPFDGGRVLQAMLWPRKGYESSMLIATGIGMVGAILIGLLGLFSDNWLLLGIAVFGYMTCYQNRRMIREMGAVSGDAFGYDFSKGHGAFDDEGAERKPGYFERRRTRKAEAKAQRQLEEEQKRSQRVEDILKKVSASGMDSLTSGERSVLEEETIRRQTSDK